MNEACCCGEARRLHFSIPMNYLSKRAMFPQINTRAWTNPRRDCLLYRILICFISTSVQFYQWQLAATPSGKFDQLLIHFLLDFHLSFWFSSQLSTVDSRASCLADFYTIIFPILSRRESSSVSHSLVLSRSTVDQFSHLVFDRTNCVGNFHQILTLTTTKHRVARESLSVRSRSL